MAEKDVKIILSATDKTRGAFASAQQGIQKLSSAASSANAFLGGLLPAIGAAGLASFAKQGIDAADALNDMSDRLGVSVKDLASFKLAAQLADTSLEGVGKGIGKLSRSIGEAERGNKTLLEALGELGIKSRDPKEAFFQLADAVKTIEDPARRAALLNQVLGRSYEELVPLLSQGGDALRKSAIASESFAESMARLAPEAAKFNDQLDVMKQNLAGLAGQALGPAVKSLNQYVAAMKDVVKNGSALEKLGFFTLGFITEESLNRISEAGDRVQDYNLQIAKLQTELVHLQKVAGPEASIVKKYEADIARLVKVREGLIAQARKDAAAAAAPPKDDLVNYGADIQAALKKAFSTSSLDTFLDTFKDRRKKIVAEYKGLRADLAGGTAADATSLDVSAQLTRGRAALEQGDSEGAQAAAAKAKELFAAVSQKEGTASFEKSYFAGQLESFELSIVDSAEKAAATAQKVFTEKMAALNQDSKNLTVNVDADGLVAQVKYAVEQVKKDLAANPLRIPVVAVPTVTSDGRQSVDLSREALKYGNRR